MIKIKFISSLHPMILCSLFLIYTDNHAFCNNSLMCQTPTNISFGNAGNDYDFFWNGVSNATGYQLKIGEAGFDPYVDQPYFETQTISAFYFGTNFTGSNQSYEVYIRTICNNGDTSDYSVPVFIYIAPTCGDTFYDSGGPDGDMSDNEMIEMEICPDTPGEYVQLIVNDIDFDPCCSFILIDLGGSSTFIPVNPDQTYTSLAPDGCLTFNVFNFNDPSMGEGWDISVECVTCPQVPLPNLRSITNKSILVDWQALGIIENIEWEVGQPGFVPFSGNAEFSGTRFFDSPDLNITGLAANTEYELFTRNLCGTEVSALSEPVFFKTAPSCDDPFYDLGGPDGPVSNNSAQFAVMTSCPEQAGDAIEVSFDAFDLGNGSAALRIFDGTDNFSPQIGFLQGTDIPSETFTSSHPTGCLAFRFIGPVDFQPVGWEAQINCTTCPVINGFNLESSTFSSAVISWDPILNANSYEWEVGEPGFEPGMGNELFLGSVPSNENVVGITGLERNTVYEIYIKALCSAENGDYFHSYHFSTQATCGDFFFDEGGPNSAYNENLNLITTICSADPNDPVTVQFNLFNTESCCDFLNVYDAPNHHDLSAFLGSFSGSANPGTFTATNPEGCLTFEFRSNATNEGNGWEAAVLCNATAIIEQSNAEQIFEIYPNPTSDLLNIHLAENLKDEFVIQIRDITGGFVFEKMLPENNQMETFELDTNDWPNGTYICILKNNNKTATKRFVKI